MKYRKKPVVIEAIEYLPFVGEQLPHEIDPTFPVIDSFHKREVFEDWKCPHCYQAASVHGWVETLEGGHIACPGDFIIKGVQGEFYPCKPDIFAATYEAVDE